MLDDVIGCQFFLIFQGKIGLAVLEPVIGYYRSLSTIRVKIRVQIGPVFAVDTQRRMYPKQRQEEYKPHLQSKVSFPADSNIPKMERALCSLHLSLVQISGVGTL
mgnify:CR=1